MTTTTAAAATEIAAHLESPGKATQTYILRSPSRRALHDVQNALPEHERDQSWEHPDCVQMAPNADGSLTFTRDRLLERHRTYREIERRERQRNADLLQLIATMAQQSASAASRHAQLARNHTASARHHASSTASHIASLQPQITAVQEEVRKVVLIEEFEAISAIVQAINNHVFDVNRTEGTVLSEWEKTQLKKAKLHYLTHFFHPDEEARYRPQPLASMIQKVSIIIEGMGAGTLDLVQWACKQIRGSRDVRNELQHPTPDATTILRIVNTAAPVHLPALVPILDSNPQTIGDNPKPILSSPGSYLGSTEARRRLAEFETTMEHLRAREEQQLKEAAKAAEEAAEAELAAKEAAVTAVAAAEKAASAEATVE